MVQGSGSDEDTERAIFKAYDRMRQIEEEAKGKTKAVRRAAQRRSLGLGATTKQSPSPSAPPVPKAEPAVPNILPFDDMDDMSGD
jgi:putative transposase